MPTKTTPKDFFLYIAALVTLYISAGSLIALWFQIIDLLLPDQLDYYVDPYSGAIRFAIASLLIIFPVYLWVSWYVTKDLRITPEKRDLGIRKWLIYLTVFLAGAIVIGDLVALINTFLGGEITSRFGFKVLAVLTVAGSVFGYYSYDLKLKVTPWESPKGVTLGKILAIATLVVIAASVISGFVVMGSPATQRHLRFDDRRVADLQTIQWQILNYWQAKGALPATLATLNDPLTNFQVPTDPETNQVYNYAPTGSLKFKLCATFRLANNTKDRAYPAPVVKPVVIGNQDNWSHPAGEQCFTRTIDPDLYPLRPKS